MPPFLMSAGGADDCYQRLSKSVQKNLHITTDKGRPFIQFISSSPLIEFVVCFKLLKIRQKICFVLVGVDFADIWLLYFLPCDFAW